MDLLGAFPSEAVGWFIRGYIFSVSIGVIQLFLSIKYKSFVVPIGEYLLKELA